MPSLSFTNLENYLDQSVSLWILYRSCVPFEADRHSLDIEALFFMKGGKDLCASLQSRRYRYLVKGLEARFGFCVDMHSTFCKPPGGSGLSL